MYLILAGAVAASADIWSRSSNGYLYPTNGTDNINISSSTKNSTFYGDVRFFDNTYFKIVTSSKTIYSVNFSASGAYHGAYDWIAVPTSVSLTGIIACNALDNLITGITYTCQVCTDAILGGTVACSATASVIENCACKVD